MPTAQEETKKGKVLTGRGFWSRFHWYSQKWHQSSRSEPSHRHFVKPNELELKRLRRYDCRERIRGCAMVVTTATASAVAGMLVYSNQSGASVLAVPADASIQVLRRLAYASTPSLREIKLVCEAHRWQFVETKSGQLGARSPDKSCQVLA
jgi:hypothetical protein